MGKQGMAYGPQTPENVGRSSYGRSWSNSFWACCSPVDLCFMGNCCPCFLFGRTQSRMRGNPDASSCNGACTGWFALGLIGCPCIIQTMKRGDMRHQYNIEGDGCMDFLGACWCPCCGLIQEEKEARLRTTGAPPHTGMQYQAPNSMSYP